MHFEISQEELFEHKEDLVKREDVIWAVINAMSIPIGRKLSITDIRILFSLIDIPAIK